MAVVRSPNLTHSFSAGRTTDRHLSCYNVDLIIMFVLIYRDFLNSALLSLVFSLNIIQLDLTGYSAVSFR